MLSPLTFRPSRRRPLRAAALALVVAAAACGDDPVGLLDDEPEIESIRFTVTPPGGDPANTVELTCGGSTTVSMRVGANALSAVGLDVGGDQLDLDEFQLRVTGRVTGDTETADPALPAPFTYATSPTAGVLTGTLTATAAVPSAATLTVRMHHLEEGHSDCDADILVVVAP